MRHVKIIISGMTYTVLSGMLTVTQPTN